jgi:hypothetical protein
MKCQFTIITTPSTRRRQHHRCRKMMGVARKSVCCPATPKMPLNPAPEADPHRYTVNGIFKKKFPATATPGNGSTESRPPAFPSPF